MSLRTSKSNDVGSIVSDNLVRGVGVGAATYLLGYVVTFLLVVVDGVQTDQTPLWKFVGIVFYGAHNVEAQASFSIGDQTQTQTIDVFSGSGNLAGTVPEPVYLLVPAALLVGAGFVMFGLAGRRLTTAAAAALGATVTAGYLVLGAAGVFLFEFTQSSGGLISASATVGPDLVTGIVLVGLVYPVLFGAVGGIVGESMS